jgi:type VI secretion system protein ImpL
MMRTSFRVLIALLIAALIWWIGPLIAIGIYHPLGWVFLRQVLVVAVLLWGFWPLLVRLWIWISSGARSIKPVKKTNVFDGIQGKLLDLERRLRARWQRIPRKRLQAWRGRIGREHNSYLPWFLVLGAEGSGKTRLVAQGLAPDALHPGTVMGESSAVSNHEADLSTDAGGELECWLGSEAVWLDTSGKWSLRDDLNDAGHNAWKKMLQGVKKLRRDPSLNGVVMCIDAHELMHTALEQRKRLAESLRARLDELHQYFGQCMQVYVALTGLDKLDGAVSTLSLMSPAQWVQGVGFSLPATAGARSDAEMPTWQSSWLELEHRVQQHVLYVSPTAGGIAENLAQLRFVEALSKLRAPLFDALRAIFVLREDDTVARLRGIWIGSVADMESRPEQANPYPEPLSSLALLWRPLLRQTLNEQGLARHGISQTWKARAARGMRWGLLALVATLAFTWLSWGYLTERNQLKWLWAQFSEGTRLARMEATTDAAASPLMHVSSQMRYARAQLDEAERALATPYVEHRRLIAVATETYHRHLQKSLLPELHNLVQQTLIAQTKGTPGDIYLSLKIYLMLVHPTRRHGDELERWINAQWERIAVGQFTTDDRRELVGHLRALFAIPDLPGTPLDAGMVQAARAKAAQIPSVTRVIQDVRNQGLPAQISDISLASAAGFETSMTLRMRSNIPITDTIIPGWYTRAGYNEVFLQRLDKSTRAVMEEESWVLRDENLTGNTFEIDRSVQLLADATRSQYLQDYVTRWQSFLNDVTVRNYTGLDDAAQIASTMIDPQSALAQLIRFTARETMLTGNYDGDIDSWIERQKHNFDQRRRSVVGELTGQHLRNKLLPEHVLEDHFEALRSIALQLRPPASNSNNPLARLFEPLYRQLGLVNGAALAGQVMPEYDAFSRLRNEAARQPEPVRGIMLDLVNNGGRLSVKESRDVLTKTATRTTHLVCDQGIAGRYPMQVGASSEIGVQDYERLFGAQGAMATYFREQLAAYVDTTRSPWQAKRAQGSEGALLSSDVLRSFETAERIRAATLDEGGRLRVSTILHVVDMDPQLAEAQLELAGQSLRYSHGSSAPRRIDWGSQNSNLSVKLSLRSVDGRTEVLRFDGPWALFRFFDAGTAADGGSDRKQTTYQTGLGSVRLEWQAVTSPSPIWSSLLHSFRCPR